MSLRSFTFEWMHRFVLGRVYTVRVWTKALPQDDNDRAPGCLAQRHELKQAIRKSWDAADGAEGILRDLVRLEFVSAVEILDEDGNGPIVYVDWP